MRLRFSTIRSVAAITAVLYFTTWVVVAQSGSTGVPPRPPVGPKFEAPSRPTTHTPRPIPPPNP